MYHHTDLIQNDNNISFFKILQLMSDQNARFTAQVINDAFFEQVFSYMSVYR